MAISRYSRKIAISFVLVLGLLLAMVAFDLSHMNTMQSKLDLITKEHNKKSNLMVIIRNSIYERQVSLRNILLLTDPFARDEGKTKFSRYAVDIVKAREEFLNLPLTQKEKNLITKIIEKMPDAYQAQHKLIEISIFDDSHVFSQEEMDAAFETQKVVLTLVKDMISLQEEATLNAVMDAEQSYQQAKISSYVLGAISIVFGVFIAVYIIRFTETQVRFVNEAMATLEKSHELLENRVNERTEELADARDAALASNKTKDNFLATMSHELRTPLNIIIGYSEMLEEQAIEDNQTSYIPDLKKIQSAGNHQLKLVSNILDISKIEEGKLDISPIEFDIEKMVSEVREETQALMEKNNNIFEVHCTPNIGLMYSDNMRFK